MSAIQWSKNPGSSGLVSREGWEGNEGYELKWFPCVLCFPWSIFRLGTAEYTEHTEKDFLRDGGPGWLSPYRFAVHPGLVSVHQNRLQLRGRVRCCGAMPKRFYTAARPDCPLREFGFVNPDISHHDSHRSEKHPFSPTQRRRKATSSRLTPTESARQGEQFTPQRVICLG